MSKSQKIIPSITVFFTKSGFKALCFNCDFNFESLTA